MSEIDIRMTLAKVCRRATRDRSVDEVTRSKRIQGLLLLGEVFTECGASEEAGLGDLISRLGAQMAAAQAAKAGAGGGDETEAQGGAETKPVGAASASKATAAAAAPSTSGGAKQEVVDLD